MSQPVVTVKNHSSREIFVAGDPNWDDQQLIINDHVITEVFTLAKGATCTVSVGWEGAGEMGMFGVVFAEAPNYDGPGVGMYQLTVGQDSKTGDLGITDDYSSGALHVDYTLSDQTPWAMKMDFKDASK